VRVLVVSQDPKERARATSALALIADVEVEEAATAEQARVRLLSDGPAFDVLVIDGDLQPRGGYAVLYDLRNRAELGDFAAVPSLVLASREHDRWIANWAGANELLLKPVDPFELARRVTALEGAPLVPYGDAGSSAQQVAAALQPPR
jgi:DNA-binding response OmpR family regulator